MVSLQVCADSLQSLRNIAVPLLYEVSYRHWRPSRGGHSTHMPTGLHSRTRTPQVQDKWPQGFRVDCSERIHCLGQ
jgi:hypothetical protein